MFSKLQVKVYLSSIKINDFLRKKYKNYILILWMWCFINFYKQNFNINFRASKLFYGIITSDANSENLDKNELSQIPLLLYVSLNI